MNKTGMKLPGRVRYEDGYFKLETNLPLLSKNDAEWKRLGGSVNISNHDR